MELFEGITNPNKQGDIGLGIAIGYFSSKRYIVSIPLTDSQDYDLIVEEPETKRLLKVQVKTSNYKKSNDFYKVHLRTTGGNRSGTGKTKFFTENNSDLLFVVSGDKKMYLIPLDNFENRSCLTLGDKYREYEVEF